MKKNKFVRNWQNKKLIKRELRNLFSIYYSLLRLRFSFISLLAIICSSLFSYWLSNLQFESPISPIHMSKFPPKLDLGTISYMLSKSVYIYFNIFCAFKLATFTFLSQCANLILNNY